MVLPEKAEAQLVPTFNMLFQDDTTVYNCKGILYDNGGPGSGLVGIYQSGTNDTFRICTGGSITLTFSQFLTEQGWDSIFFYNGLTISPGTMIGTGYSGLGPIPPIIASSGCLTIVFRENGTLVQLEGFKAQWRSTVVAPIPPTFSISPVPTCSATALDLRFNRRIHCDSIYPLALGVTGPLTTSVIGVTPIGCAADSTDHFQILLSNQLDESCNYNVDLEFKMLDNCDSVWIFNITNSFTITDCPLTVTITPTPNDSICIGSCVQLEGVVNGCLSYDYLWSHGLPNSPTQNVCPTSTTTYTLGVRSTFGGPTFTGSITITIIQPTITALPGPICQSDQPFNLTGSPPGGVWSGRGIVLPGGSSTGLFDPDSSAGTHTIYYTIGGLCSATTQITVKPMDAGLDEAACTGSPPFSVSTYTPMGGTWSGGGGYISSAGTFTPTVAGTYTVTYSHSNGCSDTKRIFVNALNVSPLVDTVCESAWSYTLTASPPGGRWELAPGVYDTVSGKFIPGWAGPGLKKIVYKLNGCKDTLRLFVKPANAGGGIVFCPLEPQDTVAVPNPPGGIWYSYWISNGGASTLVNNQGVYNPNAQGLTNFNEGLVFNALNGCFDTIFLYSRVTNIYKDSLFFCLGTDPMKLNQYSNTQFDPGGGVWTGPGVVKNGNEYFFNPSLTGTGVFSVVYTANTCFDSVKMVVYPPALSYSDTTLCNTNPPFILDPSVGANAHWQGPGIVNAQTGLFNPAAAGPGVFNLIYDPRGGCKDTIVATIYNFSPAYISNINSIYCNVDTNFTAGLTPLGGTLTLNGIPHSTNINPDSVGPGTHRLVYTYGSGFCITTDSISLTIFPPIQTTLTASRDTICNGNGSILSLNSSGGSPYVTSHTYSWSNGLFSSQINQVTPSVTTTYYVSTSDGCSDDAVDSITVHIFPAFSTSFITSPIGCYGSSGTANVTVTGTGTYAYSWSTSPVQSGNAITGLSGVSYFVKVRDINSNCSFDTTIKIPGYGIIKSLFSANPNLTCVPYDQSLITFLDLSLGASQGYWDLGDTTIPYTPGVNPTFNFNKPGKYPIKLHVLNEGNCEDEYSLEICILDPTLLFIPDIFSPNGDGLNDVFYVRGEGITELYFVIYDRWGIKIFETTDNKIGWDGTINGKDAMPGIYVWHIAATMLDGKKIVEKGDISLVK